MCERVIGKSASLGLWCSNVMSPEVYLVGGAVWGGSRGAVLLEESLRPFELKTCLFPVYSLGFVLVTTAVTMPVITAMHTHTTPPPASHGL